VPLDVTDSPGIDRLGAALHERYGRLDVLLGNAGVLGALSPIGHIEPKLFEQVMAVNVTANWRLIRSLDPLLRGQRRGREAQRGDERNGDCANVHSAILQSTWLASERRLRAIVLTEIDGHFALDPLELPAARPRFRIRTGIVDGDLVT